MKSIDSYVKKNLIISGMMAMGFLNIAILVYKLQHKDLPPTIPVVIEKSQTSPINRLETPKEILPKFIDVPQFRTPPEQSVYGDVLAHSQKTPFGDSNGRATNAHETGHDIHSYLRNKYTSEIKKKVNGFYVLQGRGIIIEEPNIRKNQINSFVPQSLRSYRYSKYLVGQQEWDDTPLYIYDEWSAYVLGGKCNVDDVQNGRYKGEWTDGVSGCLDFSIYAISLAMTVKEKDPVYWESNKQFRDYTIWNLRESYKTYMLGHRMEHFKWDKQDALLKNFLTSSDAEQMRKFVKENLDGVWLNTDNAELTLTYEPHQCKTLEMDECHLPRK